MVTDAALEEVLYKAQLFHKFFSEGFRWGFTCKPVELCVAVQLNEAVQLRVWVIALL